MGMGMGMDLGMGTLGYSLIISTQIAIQPASNDNEESQKIMGAHVKELGAMYERTQHASWKGCISNYEQSIEALRR